MHIVSDYSLAKLKERGKYLTEVIDKLPNKVRNTDIENLPEGNNIVCYGPSSGKTSAVRQFIVDHILDTGVFATKLTEDADDLRYDIVAQLVYTGYDVNYALSLVRSFHSNTEELTPYDLQSTPWIICTHERLFIEPPSLLFVMDLTTVGTIVTDISDVYRKYLFIDEYPSTMYKYFNVSSLGSLRLFDHEAGTYGSTDTPIKKSIARTAYVSKMYDNPTKNPLLLSMMDNLPTPTDQCYSRDISRGNNSAKSEFSKRRISFFADNLLNKLDDYEQSEDMSLDDKLYYTINDFIAKNKYVFDGTGDILMKSTDIWNIVKDDRFGRTLSLSSDIERFHTDVTRQNSLADISLEYSDFIKQVLESNPDSKILVYTWKTSKMSDNDLPDSIRNLLGKDASKVDFVHYMSGKERVTSEYSDHDIAMVLGRFYIPNYSVQMLNSVNHTDLSVDDYVRSLIIQFIYRTQARLGKSIKLYFTDDYSLGFISDLLDLFKLTTPCSVSSIVTDSRVRDKIIHTNNDLLTNIFDSSDYIEKDADHITVTSNTLKLLIGLSPSSNNNAIKYKLNNNHITYDYISSRPSKYIIYSK